MPWSEESRARAAAKTREQQPWLHATGPRTDVGKTKSSRNADKGQIRPKIRRLSKLLRQFETNAP